MYDLCAYYTNDGSVGLYSKDDDDIYHSAYGAASEAWEKFILPAKLNEFMLNNSSIKILDICYGIGYNSKAALQSFINFKKKNFSQKKINKICKKNISKSSLVEAIDTDNILAKYNVKNLGEIYKQTQNSTASIDADNIIAKLLDKKNENLTEENENNFCNRFYLDAVDTNDILIKLSPFFRTRKKIFSVNKSNYKIDKSEKLKQISEINHSKLRRYKNEYTFSEDMIMLLTTEMLKNMPCLFEEKKIYEILKSKKYNEYFDKKTMNFAQFYQNLGYKVSSNVLKSGFLHNIYYRYLSKSYKLAQNLSKNSSMSLNFHVNDARTFVLASENKYDFIFLDAFTPTKCPMLWTLDFCKLLLARLEDNGMILTYSNSVIVRNTFLLAGFYVGKIFDKKLNKFTGTVAVKNKNLIEYPLDEKDLLLINSKAGIPYRDLDLNLSNIEILRNRAVEFKNSNLIPSSRALKGLKNENI